MQAQPSCDRVMHYCLVVHLPFQPFVLTYDECPPVAMQVQRICGSLCWHAKKHTHAACSTTLGNSYTIDLTIQRGCVHARFAPLRYIYGRGCLDSNAIFTSGLIEAVRLSPSLGDKSVTTQQYNNTRWNLHRLSIRSLRTKSSLVSLDKRAPPRPK
ncbi:hypothetical protein BJV77DRAFT_155998 [Russula vinacea]|nr:hypothetical protein BJV77DRAFT_155998 [Russula vinacea]